MKKIIITCDLCGTHDKTERFRLSVLFTTEQDEGRAVDPYFELAELDVCETCKKKIIEERKIPTAEGAMGYNKYSL